MRTSFDGGAWVNCTFIDITTQDALSRGDKLFPRAMEGGERLSLCPSTEPSAPFHVGWM